MKPLHILAHRANLRGPDHAHENTVAAVQEALACGFGLETDIRLDAAHGFYISHDRQVVDAQHAFAAHAALWRQYPQALIALNIKELGAEAALLQALYSEGVAQQVFLFDMELLEPVAGATAALLRTLDAQIALAARVSDRAEPLAQALSIGVAQSIWLDEFDAPWADRASVQALKAAGRTVYAVSPDLHGYSLEQSVQRWHVLLDWGVDGICTDWPLRLREELQLRDNESTSP
jgi:glycerophosphoryl diester phosphodiesterase